MGGDIMKEIKQEEIKMIDKGLLEYIVYDTQYLIQKFDIKVIREEFEVFSKFDEFFETTQNVTELIFKYYNVPNIAIPCDVVSLLIKLTRLWENIRSCDYKFEEVDFIGEPEIANRLYDFIDKAAQGIIPERNTYFTEKDIDAYKKQRLAEKEVDITLNDFTPHRINNQRLIEKRAKLNQFRSQDNNDEAYGEHDLEKIKKWREENLNKDFDATVLTEDEVKVLRAGLEREFIVAINYIQFWFNMGYPKASIIFENLETYGAISTEEEAKDLGLAKSERVIKISLE